MLCGYLTTVLLFAAVLASATAIPISHHGPSLELRHSLNTTKRYSSPVPIGTVLTHCVVPGVVALTFDDGPYIYTPEILETLSQHGARATFFLNGVNKGSIEGFPEIVHRAHAEGHQLGSHTWGHVSLDTLDYPAIVSQMTILEEAFIRILGAYPTYMRVPYFAFNSIVLTAMTDLGYHVIGASVDTKDYENDDPELSYRSFEKFRNELNAGGTVILAHDTHQTTAQVLVDNMLNEIESRGLQMVPIGECLDDPPEFWYSNAH